MAPHPVKVAVKYPDQFRQVLNIQASMAATKTGAITVKETIRLPTRNERHAKQPEMAGKFETLTKIRRAWVTNRMMGLNVAHNRHRDRLIVIIAHMYEKWIFVGFFSEGETT